MKTTYQKESILCLSTGHITKKDSMVLSDLSKHKDYSNGIMVFDYVYGFLIHVYAEDLEENRDMIQRVYGLSEECFSLFKLTKENNCTCLRLDCDAPEVDTIPKFDW